MLMQTVKDTVTDFATFLLSTPKGRAMAEQAEAHKAEAIKAERQRLAAALAAVTRDVAQRFHAFEPVRVAAQAEIEAHQATLKAAESRFAEAAQRHRGEMCDLDRQQQRLQSLLRSSASPQIAAFVAELRALVTVTAGSRDSVSERGIDGRMYPRWSNTASVDARIAAISALIHEQFQESAPLWFAVIEEPALTATLDALRASLPAVDARPSKYGGGA